MKIERFLELLLSHIVCILHVVLYQFNTDCLFSLLLLSYEIGVQFATSIVQWDEILLESFEAMLLVSHYVFKNKLNVLQNQVWSMAVYIHLETK
jgi:hypothetical protein